MYRVLEAIVFSLCHVNLYVLLLLLLLLQHLYSALKSEDTKALVASGYDCLNNKVLRSFLKDGRVRQAQMSEGSAFQVVAAATEKAR